METLENIFSGRGEAMPSPEPVTTQETTQTPVTETPPAPETKPEADEPESVDVNGQKMVPHQALHAEKQKVKRYTEQVADFERKLAEQQAENRRFQQQLLETVRPPQQQQEPPDFFVNPNEATLHTVAPHIQQLQQQLMANARLVAEVKYGDKVDLAERSFLEAFQTQRLEPADYHKVVNSPNRYAAAVQWLEAQERNQPDFEERVRADERAKVLAEQQNGTNNGGGSSPPVMPSNFAAVRNVGNRSGPTWGGPSAVADIFNRHRAPKAG